jgi:hypothetical protein
MLPLPVAAIAGSRQWTATKRAMQVNPHMVGWCSKINVVGPESMLFGIWKVLMRSGADAFKFNLHLEAPEIITTSGGYSRGQAVTSDEESDAGQEVVWFKGI